MFACHLPDVQTECEIILPLLSLKTHYKSSIFVLLVFVLLKEGKAQCNCHMLLTTIHAHDCQK